LNERKLRNSIMYVERAIEIQHNQRERNVTFRFASWGQKVAMRYDRFGDRFLIWAI
jgi:hypothetical protein